MVKFLSDVDSITKEFTNLVKNTREKLVIISPYLKVDENISNLIKGKAEKKSVLIQIIYGKNDLSEKEKNWIENCNEIKLYFRKNLHAKCYLSDEKAIITSMNLYKKNSQENNDEFGILLNRDDDKEAFQSLKDQINYLIDNSEIKELNLNKNFNNTNDSSFNNHENKDDYLKELSKKDSVLFLILKDWRLNKSKEIKRPAYTIFKDNELKEIIEKKPQNFNELHNLHGISDKKIKTFGKEILELLKDLESYSIVQIIDTQYEFDSFNGNDRIKVRNLDSNKEEWLDTIQNLPKKNSIVGVKINRTPRRNWFNDYFEIE